jgi:hypothetical protein
VRVTHYRGIFIIRELEATDYQDIDKPRSCILSFGTKSGTNYVLLIEYVARIPLGNCSMRCSTSCIPAVVRFIRATLENQADY